MIDEQHVEKKSASSESAGAEGNKKIAGKYVPPHLRGQTRDVRQEDREDRPRSRERGSYDRDERPRSRDRGGGDRWGGDDRGGGKGGGSWGDRGDRGGGGKGGGRFDRRDDDRGGGGGSRFDRSDNGPSEGGNSRWSDLGGAPPRKTRGPQKRDELLEKQLFGEKTTGINFDKYNDIPVEVSSEDGKIAAPFNTVAEIPDLPEELALNFELCGYTVPTPVQKNAWPIALQHRDIMACAQTGSGKTAAFLFPLVYHLLKSPPEEPPSDGGRYSRRSKHYPSGLIMAPTRELATQIYEEALKFTYRTVLRPVVVYGGQDIKQQFRELERGCDFIVATPGRLYDMIERGQSVWGVERKVNILQTPYK